MTEKEYAARFEQYDDPDNLDAYDVTKRVDGNVFGRRIPFMTEKETHEYACAYARAYAGSINRWIGYERGLDVIMGLEIKTEMRRKNISVEMLSELTGVPVRLLVDRLNGRVKFGEYYTTVIDTVMKYDFNDGRVWRQCPSFPLYEASDRGEIRNIETGRILKYQVNKKGYRILTVMCPDGKIRTVSIHKLVADAFYGPNVDRLDVNHEDGDKQNNRPDNLTYCTRKENVQHAFRTGLNRSHKKKAVRIVETGQVFASMIECAEYLDVDRASIKWCIKDPHYRCRGYHIELVDNEEVTND